MLEPKQGEEGVPARAEVSEEVIPALGVAPGAGGWGGRRGVTGGFMCWQVRLSPAG